MQKLGSNMDFGQEAILGLAGEGLPDLLSVLPEAAASLPQTPSLPASATLAKPVSRKQAGADDLMPPPPIKAIYDRVAAEEGVPVNVLVAMGHTESRHRPNVDGPETKYGAAGGIMQYLPGMAAAHKINRYNPEESIRQAAKDLRERLAKNKGDMANAVARHHAGDNPEQLGPKSRAYAETILAKARRLAPAYEAEQAAQLKSANAAREASREQAAEAKRSEYYPAGAAAASTGRTWLQAGGDTLAQLAEGVNTIAGAPAELIAPDSGFAQFFRDGADYWRRAQSEDMQRRIAQADKRISQAGEDGLLAQMAAAASEYTDDPALAARLVATNAASLIPGVAAAKLAQAAAIARGATAAKAAAAATTAAGGVNAVLNAGGARGEAYQDLRQTLIAQGMAPEAATEIALRESLPSAAAGGLAGFLSGKIGLEKALVGQGGAGVRGAAGAAAAELAGEQVEEVAPQLTTNLMAGQYDGRSILKDVGRTIVETGIASGPGAAISAVAAHGPLGRAVSKARVLQPEQVAPAGPDLYHDVVGDQMFENVGLSQHEDITRHQEDVIGPNMPAWGHQPAAELAGQPVEVGRKENFAADYPVPPAPDAAAIADADARVAAAREQESAAQRRQILDGVLSDSAVRNPVAKFAAELARAGYAQAMPSADELATIERFSAAKDAFAGIDPDVTPQAPAAPNTMGDDDAVDWRAQRDAEIMGEDEGDGLAQPVPQSQQAPAGQATAQGGQAAKPSTPQGFTPEQAAIADQSRAANQFIKLLRKAGHPVNDELAMVALWKAHKAQSAGQQSVAPAIAEAPPASTAAQPAPVRQNSPLPAAPSEQQAAVSAKPPKQKNWHKKAAQVDIERDTVRDAVARLGGIRKDEAMREWGATLVEGAKSRIFGKPVFRAKGGAGMPLDKMREALAELGYLSPDSDINDLYQAFEQDSLHHVGQERRAATMAQQAATESQASPAGEAAAADPERTLDNHPVYDPWYDFDPDAILPDDLNEAAASAGDFLSPEYQAEYEIITTELNRILGADEAEAIVERAAIMADAGRNFFEAIGELINERQSEQAQRSTEPSGETAEAPAGQSGAGTETHIQEEQPDTGRAAAAAGQPGDGDAGILQSYDQAELDAREQAQRAADSRRQEEERAADRKRQADAEVGDFVLTGSDSMADQLAARGQGGLFDAPSTAPNIEQPAPNISSGNPGQHGPFGPVYHGFTNKPEQAISKLLQEQQGEVPDAYVHPELGNIALLYGDEKMGLRHIIARRGMAWVDRIPGILRNGELVRDGKHPRAYLVDHREDPAHVSVVRLQWDGHEKTWLMTAYEDDQGKFARQSRLSNEPTASAASRIPAANGQAHDSTVKSDGEVFEFPTRQIAESYRHVSHRGSDRAKAEENAFRQSIEQIRNDVSPMVETEAQQAAFDSAMADYQNGYIDAALAVARAREGTMSPLVAGRNNFNGKQAARTGGAYEKAQDEFARKVGRLKAAVEKAVRDARTPEQIQAEQDKAAEKARKKSILNFAKAAGAIADDLRNDRKAMAGDTRKWANKDMMALLDGMDEATQRQAVEGSDKALKELGGLAAVVGPRSTLGKRVAAILDSTQEDGETSNGDSVFPDGARLSVAEAEAAPVVDQLDAARGESAAAAQATPATDEGSIDAGVSRNDRSESGEARRISVEDAGAIVRRILADVDARSTERVRVIPSVAMLPPQIQQWLDNEVNEQDHDVPAVYWSGNTYIIAENLRSEAHLEEALLHEVMGHYGVRALFGAETDVRMRQLFDDIGGWKGYLDIAEALGLKERLMPYYLDFKDSQRLNFVMMDELLGHMAGLNKWPKRQLHALIGRLKAYLRQIGFAQLPKYTVSDLAHILSQARSLVIAGDDRLNPVAKEQRSSIGAASMPALTVADLQDVFQQSPLGSWVDRLIASGRLTIKPSLVLPEGYKHLEATQAFTVDGKITMFAGNIGGRQRVMPVLLHEVFHSSGEALLGSKEWGKLIAELDQLRQHAEANPAGKAGKLWGDAKRRVQEAIENGDNMTRADMAEELGAYAIELADQAPLTWQRWVDRLLGHMKAWARRVFGVQLGRLTPEQLRALAIAALREGSTAANPGPRLSMRDKEVEGIYPGAKDGQQTGDLRGEKKREAVERNQDSYADANAAQSVKVSRSAGLIDEAGRYAVKAINSLRTTWGVVSDNQKSIPAIRDAYDLQGAMDGRRIGIATEATKSFGREFSNMAIKDPDAADKLADLMTQATLWQIKPDKPKNDRWRQAWKDKHDELSAKWDALPQGARDLYDATQKFYEARSKDIHNALKERIMAMEIGEKQKRDLLAELQDRFDRELGTGPYFPLARFGSYLVIAVKGEGDNAQRVVMNAEYAPEANAMAAELRQRGYTVTTKLAKDQAQDQDMRQSSELVRKIAEMIEMQVPDFIAAPMLDELNQIFLDALPLASARKSFIHRKNVAGFSRDMARALNQSAVKLAGQIAKLEYAQKIEDAFDKADEQAKESPDNFDLQPVVSEMRKRFDSTMKFKTHPVAAALQQAGFAFTLAYNLSSAAVNLLQMVIAGGHMGARHGAVKANAQIAKALGQIAATAKQRDKNAHIFDLRKSGSQLDAGEKNMLEALEKSGKIDVTAAMDAYRAAHEDTKRIADSKFGRVMQKVLDGMGMFMQAAEVVNRQAVALAAYRMELKSTDGDVNAATTYAAEVLDNTQFNMNISNQPRFMHKNVMRVVMQYKGFAINMMDYLGRTMRTAMDGMDPAERRQATKALGLIFAMQVALAGIGSLPLYIGAAATGAKAGKLAARAAGGGTGAARLMSVFSAGAGALALAAFLNGAFGDDDEPWDWKADMRRWLAANTNATLAQLLDRGLFSIAGVDIADRISMNGLMMRDLQEQHGKQAWTNMAKEAALSMGGVALSKFYLGGARALDALEQGNTKDAMISMLPTTLANAVKGVDMAANGVKDKRTGAHLMDVNAGEAIVQMFGFQPSDVRERRWADSVAYNADKQMQDRKSSLLNAIAEAVRADDRKAEDEAWEAAERWNDKNGDLYNPITQREVNNRVRQMDDQQATKEGEARTPGQRKQLERKDFYQQGLGQ